MKFYLTAALVNELIEAQQQGRLAKFLKMIEKVELLICDEWGFLPLSHEGAQLLFQVVSACYERKSLILTTFLHYHFQIHRFALPSFHLRVCFWNMIDLLM